MELPPTESAITRPKAVQGLAAIQIGHLVTHFARSIHHIGDQNIDPGIKVPTKSRVVKTRRWESGLPVRFTYSTAQLLVRIRSYYIKRFLKIL
jgi:hypothetical protein